MVLEAKSPSKHNQINAKNNVVMQSITKKIPHPASTRFDENDTSNEDFPSPSAKRRRIDQGSPRKSRHLDITAPASSSPKRSPRKNKRIDARAGSGDEQDNDGRDEAKPEQTQLETALPSLQTDEEAIEAYEVYKAGLAADIDLEVFRDTNEKTSMEAQADTGTDIDESTLLSRLENRQWIRGRSSIYVDAFNLALETVLDEEGHLFNQPERQVFKYWQALNYEAQYLYVRLFLRKTSAWHRIGKLGYYGDIADMPGAIVELQKERVLPEADDGNETMTTYPGEAVLPEEAIPLGHTFQFAECSDDHISTLDEASSLLLLDELKVIAKEARVAGKNKKELLHNFRRTSGRQTGLGFMKRFETEDSIDSNGAENDLPDDASDADSLGGTRTPTTKSNRDAHYTKKIMEQTGKCIRLSLLPLKLFERTHLVFYRSTEWTEKSLTTLILAKISRRIFPSYIVSRSANIFESRALLLEFEAGLRTQFRVDNIIEFSRLPVHLQIDKVYEIFEAVYPRWWALLEREQAKEDRGVYESGEGAYLRRFSPAWVYTRIIHKGLWPLARRKEYLREHEVLCELLEQRFFHAARRGAWYQRKALLEEHYLWAFMDSGGRGEEAQKKHWKRIALRTCEEGLQDRECHVIYHYDLQKRIMKLEKSLRVPRREQHEFGHVGLGKARERTIEGVQVISDDREGTPSRATSLRRKTSTDELKTTANQNDEKPTPTPAKQQPTPLIRRSSTSNSTNDNTTTRQKGINTKTWWLDPSSPDPTSPLIVSVEALSLSHYRSPSGPAGGNWKGYHVEGSLLRLLFGLLFYDILFEVYVPNVFQTAYQTAPLDLFTDAFYSARVVEVERRCNQIGESGWAEGRVREIWGAYGPGGTVSGGERGTEVVGVRWETWDVEEVCEIVRCLVNSGEFGVVMRVMAQEYAARGGGVPDLFLWKVEMRFEVIETEDEESGEVVKREVEVEVEGTGKVMFVEVKSENDRLSDTQRLWISVLLNAGFEVEVCHVLADEVRSEREVERGSGAL